MTSDKNIIKDKFIESLPKSGMEFQNPKSAFRNNTLLLFFVLINLIIKFIYLTAGEIALDEPYTLYFSQHSLSEIWSMMKEENNPPLFYFIMHFWTNWFGNGVLSARLLPWLFSSLSVGVLFKTGEKFFNLRTAIIVCIIFTASNTHIFYSHDVRVYSLFFLLSTLSFYLFLEGLYINKKSSWYLFAIINALLCFSHFLGFIVVTIEGICILLIRDHRIMLKKFLLSLSLIFISYCIYLQVFFTRLNAGSKGTWVSEPAWDDIYTMIVRFTNAPLIGVIFIASIIAGQILIYKKITPGEFRNKNGIVLISLLVSLIGTFALSFLFPVYLDRYIIFTTIYLYFIIAISIDKLFPEKKIYRAISILIPSVMLFTMRADRIKISSTTSVVNYVRQNSDSSTTLIITPEWYHLNYIYYSDPELFKINSHLFDTLNKRNIFPIVTTEHLKMIDLEKYSKIILIDASSHDIGHGNEIYDSLIHSFKLSEQKNEIDNVKVYVLKKQDQFNNLSN